MVGISRIPPVNGITWKRTSPPLKFDTEVCPEIIVSGVPWIVYEEHSGSVTLTPTTDPTGMGVQQTEVHHRFAHESALACEGLGIAKDSNVLELLGVDCA